MNTPIVDRIMEQLQVMPYDLQRRVLEFTRALALSTLQGVPGKQLLRFAGTIPASDLRMMQQAIEQGCEKINA
jgi:hypothetical protein